MFQTKVVIPDSLVRISHNDRIMSFGSCFADNIGAKLSNSFFDIDSSPFGVLYNPVSIKNSLELLMNRDQFTRDDIFEHRGLWQSFSHSSLFSDITEELCLQKINSRFLNAKDFFSKTNILIITFGTSWVYEQKKGRGVVSNCHKLPANAFIRKRLSVEQIVTSYSSLITELQTHLPGLHFIFTVSPIRHWKDGAHENNISKSTLLLAIDLIQKEFPQVHYFPSYEIQMDELRDYRFYASDMLHPSDVAVDYIWERFAETYFSLETMGIRKKLDQLSADLQHRPLFPESEEYKLFQKNTENKKLRLLKEYPFLNGRI